MPRQSMITPRKARIEMDYNDHCQRIGYIHMNLTALESSLRFFLLKANGETFAAPKPGDADVPLTHIEKNCFNLAL